tara:strand:- start:3929 stop:4870 length:942 start_codon:yes stop_codon:yes gene_type:complete
VKKIYKIILLLSIMFVYSCAETNMASDFQENENKTNMSEETEKTDSASSGLQQELDSAQNKELSSPQISNSSNHYGILIEEQSLQIKKLRAELDFVNEELYKLKAQSQVWENPFSIYNKEITLDNGSTIYGKIIYQDQNIIKAETLIGGLTIDRSTIVKVTENIVEIIPKDSLSSAPMQNFVKAGSIIEIESELQNREIERKEYKTKANLVVLGSIYEKTDENGNTILSGEIKNIGNKRADFGKINFLFRMNWAGDTKPMTAFVKGALQDLGDGIISDASIDPESIATFELFVPKSFGQFISYSYSLDWEQYE